MSVSYIYITQFAKLSFNHPSVVLTAEIFQYFNKIKYGTLDVSHDVGQILHSHCMMTIWIFRYR